MNKVLVIAPHPDDETLGCGGVILRHKSIGDQIFWLIVTVAPEDIGYTSEQISKRTQEIDTVQRAYGFSSVYQCGFTTTMLDVIPRAKIIKKISEVFQKVEPHIVYLPYCGDVHTDHQVVFDATSSCLKWFRYPSVKKALAYETLSETDFDINPVHLGFRPNVFVDISPFLEKKIEIMKIYHNEMGTFPFPRSEEAIRAQAALRGIASGFKAAEAFMLLKEIIS
jgi:N-acetylglucosamine malate deacetylase 1